MTEEKLIIEPFTFCRCRNKLFLENPSLDSGVIPPSSHLLFSRLPAACNVISQSPEGSYTMVIPQQHRNCSFSIIYPVEIDVSEFSLGHFNNFPKVNRRMKY